jgi:5-methylcytosine-specific restriction endonuclease McrA
MHTSERVVLPLSGFLRIAQRDGWRCHWCDVGYLPHDRWEVDHVVPLASGGTNHVTNLALAHSSCNATKGTL